MPSFPGGCAEEARQNLIRSAKLSNSSHSDFAQKRYERPRRSAMLARAEETRLATEPIVHLTGESRENI